MFSRQRDTQQPTEKQSNILVYLKNQSEITVEHPKHVQLQDIKEKTSKN